MAIVYIHRRNDIQDAFLNVFYVGIGKNTRRAIKKCKNPKCDKDFEQKRSFQKYCCYNCGGSVYKQKKRAMVKKVDNISKFI